MSSNSSNNSVMIIENPSESTSTPPRNPTSCPTNEAPAREQASMRPYLGRTTSTRTGLRVPFYASQDLHIGSDTWTRTMTNFSSHVSTTPFTLSGAGIVGVLHGSIHRYMSTQQVYCTCGCLCGAFLINMRDDMDVTHHYTSPFDPYDSHYDAQRQRIMNYRLEETTSRVNGRVALVFNTLFNFKSLIVFFAV